MLTTLSISNYALIKALQTDFSEGLSIITGETGAGKSILLGALGLVLGNRADLNNLKNSAEKCVIEATFSIEALQLHSFFEAEDLDYEAETIIRREILPSGKSRAFVNDTPVTLAVLNALKGHLIDVHSQNTTAQLSETAYQFQIVDALAANTSLLQDYARQLKAHKSLHNDLDALLQEQAASQQAYAYNSHLFQELEAACFKVGEQEELELAVEKLANIEAIKLALSESVHLASDEQIGGQNTLYQIQTSLQKISNYAPEYQAFLDRIHSLKIELDDLVFELEKANEQVDFSEGSIEATNERLQLLYTLQKKHAATTISDLLQIQLDLEDKVSLVENATTILEEKQAAIVKSTAALNNLCDQLHKRRKVAIPKLSKQLQDVLAKLGMENATFQISLQPTADFANNGKDHLNFLFSANKGIPHDVLKKIASGGELSRIMLGVKLILSKYAQLPTILFDEIDTGVSGEVSNKIAEVMQEMGTHMQVITITHLPQIAAKGSSHFKVYKEEVSGVTTTFLKKLTQEERVEEVAEILGGKTMTVSALQHAKELLKI
ncbi:MAG: DNA repair protein RecN [Flavicella sp.]|nr:DNA repair protein RecN [Flavicella sp.]